MVEGEQRFYLGRPVVLVMAAEERGWVWADWQEKGKHQGKRFKFWADQLLPTPWGE